MRIFRYAAYLIFCLSLALPAFAAETIRWYSLADGMQKAKAEGRPMIVDFYFGSGCARCDRLDKNVYGQPEIARKINADFIPIRIDLNKNLTPEEQRLGEKHDYRNECMLLLLDPQGNAVSDPSGKKLCFIDSVDPDWFVEYLDMLKRHAVKK